jgi:uncharacterized membrane protein (DUF106 family)
MVSKTATKTPATIGATIDRMSALKDKIKEMQQRMKPLEDDYKELERSLIEQMEAQEQARGAGKRASVTLNVAEVPNVLDWDEFYKFIGKKKWYHLLERRASVTGCRELFEQKIKVPGVAPVERKSIRLTQLKS